MPTPAVALTVAGTDSSGGAGVHADLRTFAALGVHGTSAIAAVTAQSTVAVRAVHAVPTDVVVAQVVAVVEDLDVRAVKTGFLGGAETVGAVAGLARAGRLPNLVVDPVLVSAVGERILDRSAEEAYITELLPTARILTPNRLEAGLLVGRPVTSTADMEAAAVELAGSGPELVVVKGGDAEDEGEEAVDLVADPEGRVERLALGRVVTRNDHGSGCTFAAATAARLALGDEPLEAVRTAKTFVHAGLVGSAGWRVGSGRGPLDQLGWGP
jgi:hydroxymethylpyrimidine/phosphomethylpyrimidine kinase